MEEGEHQVDQEGVRRAARGAQTDGGGGEEQTEKRRGRVRWPGPILPVLYCASSVLAHTARNPGAAAI